MLEWYGGQIEQVLRTGLGASAAKGALALREIHRRGSFHNMHHTGWAGLGTRAASGAAKYGVLK
jgi:hypothetical protein